MGQCLTPPIPNQSKTKRETQNTVYFQYKRASTVRTSITLVSSLPNKALHYWYFYTIMHRSIFRNTFLLFVLVINITFSKGENDNENDNENENDNQRQVYDFEEDCLGIVRDKIKKVSEGKIAEEQKMRKNQEEKED